MKIMKAIKILAVLAVSAGMMFTSCKKSSGPSASSLGVKIQATNKTFSVLKSAALNTPGFVWDTCFINVSKIEFEAEKRESESSKDSANVNFEWNGPKIVDLFSVSSVIGNIGLQPGLYGEVSLKIEALKSDAGTSPVFYLSGVYNDSTGVSIPVVVIMNEDIEFNVSKEGTELNGVNDYTSLINLNLTLLLNGIGQSDLSGATLTNGKIVISSTSNASLYDKIRGNLDSSDEAEFNED
jgi:hypothetical protein